MQMLLLYSPKGTLFLPENEACMSFLLPCDKYLWKKRRRGEEEKRIVCSPDERAEKRFEEKGESIV